MTVRLSGAGLVSQGPQNVDSVRGVFARHPIVEIVPEFSRPVEELEAERRRLEQATGRAMPDLTLFFRLKLTASAEPALLVEDLVRLDVVERAYVAPSPAPPPSG